MPFKKVKIEVKERVGYIFLHSTARFNKLSISTLHELLTAVKSVASDSSVSCVVLSGYPGESFAVGADIGQMVNFSSVEALSFADLGQSLFSEMEQCPKPIIGALNGITMGGGCDLALACDIRLAASSMVIAHPGAKLGIITGFCGTQKLPRAVGKNVASDIFMTSETLSALDALRVGLVNRVYGAGDFWVKVEDFARHIASFCPEALNAAKRVMNAAEDLDIRNGCLLEREVFSSLCITTACDGSRKESREK